MLVDSHCHLDFDTFAPELDDVVARARAAGVGTCVSIGTKLEKFAGVRAVAERFADVWCSVGIHPHEAEAEPLDGPEILIEHAGHPKVVGIGETGLDYYYEHSPREAQRINFRHHIAAARAAGLPLIVHTRDADDDTIAILEDEMAHAPFAGLLHCFTGTRRLAEAALALGMHISVSGIATVQELRRAACGAEGRAARAAAGGDRRALSRARAQPRQAQRACLRRAHRSDARRPPRHDAGGARPRHDRELLPPLHQGRTAPVTLEATLEATILGCGSSGGVPRLGGPDNAGEWGGLRSLEPERTGARAARFWCGRARRTLLVDTSPDMRQQLLDARAGTLDGVLISHDHADQLHGLDDLRMVAINMRRRVDVYADAATMPGMLARFGYCFVQPQGSSYPPIVEAHEIDEPFRPFRIGGIEVSAFTQRHGHIRSLGFRFGGLAYSSDVDGLDEAAFAALAGVECWIVDCLRYTPHPSHAHLALALEWIARVRPRRAVLTNLHIDLDYETLKRELPPGVEPAYDGMRIAL